MSASSITFEVQQALARELDWLRNVAAPGAAEGSSSADIGDEQIATIVASALLGLPSETIDEAITRALAVVGLRRDMLRVFYFRVESGEQTLALAYEWCAPFLHPMGNLPAYARLPFSILPAPLAATLKGGGTVEIPATRGFLADVVKERVSEEGDRALALAPVLVEGVLVGIAGMATSRGAAFCRGDVKLLRIVAHGIARAVERRRVDEALRSSEARFRAMCDASPLGIFLAGPDGECIYLNPAAERICGLSSREAQGRGWMSALHPDDRAAVVERWGSAVESRADYQTPIHRFVHRSGDVRSVEVRAVPVAGPLAGRNFVGILEDVTDRVRADQERQGLLARAQAARAEAEAARREAEDARAEVSRVLSRVTTDRDYLRQEVGGGGPLREIIGSSPSLRATLESAALVAATNTNVLIVGETGTGKELVARAVHEASPRRDRLLVRVNCAAISAGLVESELFGHERGAFTGAVQQRKGRFELADGGSLFLDEVGELPLETQGKLLRVLQEREFERVGGNKTLSVDVRIIAATNRNLPAMVQRGAFRQDLYYRLNVFPLQLPPLRERAEDIPLLVEAFVQRAARQVGKRIASVHPAAMERLVRYDWPGNIRELQNVVERAVILNAGEVLELESLPSLGSAPSPSPSWASVVALQPAPRPPAPPTIHDVERAYVERILGETRWVIEGEGGAARRLGLHPNTLRSRLKRWGFRRPQGHQRGVTEQ